MADMQSALKLVREKVLAASLRRPPELNRREPRLVAVSKTKPKNAIFEAYALGQRHFGENYIQELVQKGMDAEVVEKCPDIRWHFIGHLQRNKVNKLIDIPNLYMVESVDSDKLATALNATWLKANKLDSLNVMVQVNTSSEDNKSGIEPGKASTLVEHILKECPKLKFVGLMTIGAYDHDPSKGPNPDFQSLIGCRRDVCHALNLDADAVELSMGMSSDYEHAIEVGSSNVRVGTSIFGSRSYD